MDFFEFTFTKGDRFEHRYKAIEKYVNKNYNQHQKLDWKPKVNIQVMIDRGSELLSKDLNQLNRRFHQILYIQICSGPTIYKHVSLGIDYKKDDKQWVVTHVNHQPFRYV